MPLWGRDCPLPSISGCHPPASLPPAKEVPVPSWLALLWCSLSPLFCEKARLCFQFSQLSHSVMSDSLQPHGIQHTRPPCPSPNTGVYSNSYPLSESVMPSQPSHPLSSLLLSPSVFPSIKVQVNVTQSCLTLCNPMGCIHGILQARILEWVAFPFSRGSSQPKDQTTVSKIARGFFTS